MDVSNQTRSRLLGLIGFCYYLLGEHREAINRFQDALLLTPENSKTLANMALASLIENKLDDAIDYANKSIEFGGDDTPARAVLVNAIAIKNDFKKLDELVDETYLNDQDYVRSLAHVFDQGGDHEKAEKYYRLCLVLQEDDFYGLLGLVNLLAKKVSGLLQYKSKQFLFEAREFVEYAIQVSQEGDNDLLKSQAFSARSGILLGIGDLEGAKRDCDYVLRNSPDQVIALHNMGIIALLEGKNTLAIDYLEKLPKDYAREESTYLPLAEAYINSNNPSEAIRVTEEGVQRNLPSNLYVSELVLAKAFIKSGENEKSTNY